MKKNNSFKVISCVIIVMILIIISYVVSLKVAKKNKIEEDNTNYERIIKYTEEFSDYLKKQQEEFDKKNDALERAKEYEDECEKELNNRKKELKEYKNYLFSKNSDVSSEEINILIEKYDNLIEYVSIYEESVIETYKILHELYNSSPDDNSFVEWMELKKKNIESKISSLQHLKEISVNYFNNKITLDEYNKEMLSWDAFMYER